MNIIALSDTLPNKRNAWIINDQLIRSATSIGANIIEAKAASSRLEFKKYYEVALKSANETQYWLELMRDSKLAEANNLKGLIQEAVEIASMLAAGVIKLKSKN